jgi:hypothetical protein
MVEKMTAVWLIILTIIVCGAVPTLMIFLTTIPSSEMSIYSYSASRVGPEVNLRLVY